MNNKEKVLKYLTRIPKGKVTTYGRIAKDLGIRSARSIGKILHHNSDPDRYPCHRVVFADGSLAVHYAFGGLKAQRKRLESEGITFIGKKANLGKCLLQKIDLKKTKK